MTSIPIKCSELTNSYDISLTTGSLSHCCKFKYISLDNSEISELKGSYFDLNKETLKARTDLSQGIQTPRCKDCWELEATGNESWRTSHITDTSTIKLNLQISSLCNQSCFYCSQVLSSSIAKYKQWVHGETGDIFGWSNEKVDLAVNFEYIIQFVANLPENITTLILGLTGGEPFLVENFNDKIKELMSVFCKKSSNRRIELAISTNTNVNLENLKYFYDIINELKTKYNLTIEITSSIENLEERAEYVRGGLVWSNFVENFKLHNANADTHNVRMTVNPFTIVKIVDFVKFFSAYDMLLDYNYPYQKFFRIDVLDDSFKSELVELEEYLYLNALQNKFLGKWFSKLKLNICDDKHNAELFKKAITNIDSIRNTNWRTVFPEYIEWFDK